jgi:regulator of protease activity HflC (stomatin/prohibitin superfamily)
MDCVCSEYGLLYDGVGVRVNSEVFENGRHFPGLGSFFLKYPRKFQYIEFSSSSDGGSRNQAIGVWSKDGQSISVEAGFYFAVRKANVLDMYYKYNQEFVPVIEDVAANAMRDVATRFTTLEFFTNRSAIDTLMASELQRRVSACCFSDVRIFNLLAISVPSRFRTAVENVVISEQERTTLEILRDAIVLRQSIRVVDAEADKTITIAKARANGIGLINRTSADAAVLVEVEQARAQALYNLSLSLGLTNSGSTTAVNSSQLLTYLFADHVRSSDGILLNLPRALVGV